LQAEYLASLGDSLASKSELLTNGGSWVEFFTGALAKVNTGKGVCTPLFLFVPMAIQPPEVRTVNVFYEAFLLR
jgi:hypothetical protein